MLVSVVIPLYNEASFVYRALKSVLNQTFRDFEVIVVDDGSTDDGADVVQRLTDARIRVMRQANSGVSAARNRGIAEARGKYVALLDADDEWDAGFLEAVVQLAAEYPEAGINGTGYRMVCQKGPTIEVTLIEAHGGGTCLVTDYFRRARGGHIVNSSGVMIPKKVFAEIGGFKEGVLHGEDQEMWARIALRYPVAYDTRILFSFHQVGNNGKIRYQKLPVVDPVLKMLDGTRYASGSQVPPDHVQGFAKWYLRKSLAWFVDLNDRSATLEFLKENGAARRIPVANKLASSGPGWNLLRLLALGQRVLRSRTALRAQGGLVASKGVLKRLV